jgi:MFS family permease
MIGPIVAGQLALGDTFRPFLIFVIGAPLLAWASRMPSDPRKEAVAPPIRHLADALRGMKAAGRLRDYLGLLGTTLVAVFILHGLGLTVAPLFLDLEFGVPVDQRGFIVAAFQAGTILVALQVGRLLGLIGGRRLVTIAFAVMAAGSGIAAMATSPWHVAAGLGLAGLGFGLFIPVAQSFISLVGTDQYRGLSVLMWVTIVRVAQVVGPQVGARMTDGAGPRLAFGLAAAGMGVVAIFWIPARRLINRNVVRAGITE